MTAFDPTKHFGEVFGHIPGCAGARYTQGGALFNSQHKCLQDASGRIIEPGSDQATTTAKPVAIELAVDDAADEAVDESEDTPKVMSRNTLKKLTKLNEALANAVRAEEDVPSTVNSSRVNSLKAEIEALKGT